MNITTIQISPKYGGGVGVKATDEAGQVYILEVDELKAYLLKAIAEKGYTTKLEPRQAYKRLVINS